MSDQEIIEEFQRLYYGNPERILYNTHWLGVAAQKYPTDLWVYQEIMHEIRPDFVIETGTYWGGSALFLASICELLDHGQVISIDVRQIAESERTRPAHPRITYFEGSSISPDVVDAVRNLVGHASSVMVILDSDHGREHVFNELKVWADFVTDGSYLIVEDTNVNGHPVLPEFGPGPMEAVDLFLDQYEGFMVDKAREKFMLTANPRGYLRRVGADQTETRLAMAAETISSLEQRVADLTQERDSLSSLRSELQECRGEIERLRNSTSWRITALPRALARFFRSET